MTAETVRLLHAILDKLDRLAKPDDADWRTVLTVMDAARRVIKARDQSPHEMRVLDGLKIGCAIAERHVTGESVGGIGA